MSSGDRGKRDGADWGFTSPFIGAEGASGRGGREVTSALMALMPLKTG
jgi:hypothetical protein